MRGISPWAGGRVKRCGPRRGDSLGTGLHVADQGSVEITSEVAGVALAQFLARETQLAGVAKAETGSNGSVTGTARAVRRVMVVFIFTHPSVSGNSLVVSMVDAGPSRMRFSFKNIRLAV